MSEQTTEQKVEAQRQHEPVSFGSMGGYQATQLYLTCIEGLKLTLRNLDEGNIDSSDANELLEEFHNCLFILRQTHQV